MTGRRPVATLAVGAALWLTSCGGSDSARDTATPPSAPVTHLRAGLSLEPPRLQLGDVVTAEIVVVTPPDHRLLPVQAPEVAGAWLLDATPQDVEQHASRWIHRTRFRLRTREVGPLRWPPFEVTVEDGAGSQHAVAVAAREFEVVSTLEDFPDQATPFGLRSHPPQAGGQGFWLGAAAGMLAALALAGAAFAFHRSRDRVPPESDAARRNADEREGTLWDWGDSGLAEATASLDTDEDPRRAANQAARLLRQYVARRFDIQIEALTTEELSATRPPLAIDSRWPELVRILRRFDAERFRSLHIDAAGVSNIRSELEAVKRFVADSTPPELRR